jgi:hypothetical protein
MCCTDSNLVYHESDYVETHGLDCGPFEHWHEEWWECPTCGERFTIDDLDRVMIGEENNA